MKKRSRIELIIFCVIAAFYLLTQFANIGADIKTDGAAYNESLQVKTAGALSEDGAYSDKEQLALFIATYGHLPKNYISKKDAKAAGWQAEEGNLNEVCPGMSIGGDRFGNYDGKLPEKKGRKYFECDVNYNPDEGYRGSERIIYSNDGLIYYTDDHYNNFELLYGEP